MKTLHPRLPAHLAALALFAAPLAAHVAVAEDQLNLNTATSDDLEKLPGIGAAIAKRIVEYRDANGPFASLEDLENVKGVSAQVIEKLRARVFVVGAPSTPVRAAAPERTEITAHREDAADAPATPAAVSKLLSRYKAEPSVREVQEAAGRYAEVHPELLDSWRGRSRWAAIGPQLRGEYRYVSTDDRTDTTGGGSEPRQQLDTGVQYRPLGRIQWDLDRMIFNPDELRVSNEIVDLVRLRESVLDQVTKIYYERRRLQVDLDLTPPKDIAGRVRKELRLQELVADLDSLTGGFFSQKLVERGLDPY